MFNQMQTYQNLDMLKCWVETLIMFLSEKEEKITWLNSYNLLVNLFTAGVSRFFDEVSTKNAHGLAIKIKHNLWDNFVYKIS